MSAGKRTRANRRKKLDSHAGRRWTPLAALGLSLLTTLAIARLVAFSADLFDPGQPPPTAMTARTQEP